MYLPHTSIQYIKYGSMRDHWANTVLNKKNV